MKVNEGYEKWQFKAQATSYRRLSAKVDKKIRDDPQNVLLEKTTIDEMNKETLTSSIEFIENYENQTIEPYTLRYVQTEVGKSCFLNGITEISVFQIEEALQKKVDVLHTKEIQFDDPNQLMSVLNYLFFSSI